MFIDFQEFTLNTEAVLQQVFQFVGADGALYKHKDLPPGMQVSVLQQTLACEWLAGTRGQLGEPLTGT